MSDDFFGSIAQEDVQFTTDISKTAIPGENYMKLAVFVEAARFINDAGALVNANEAGTIKYAIVTQDNYASVTKGRLASWLADYFAEQNSYPAYVVAFTPDITDDISWDSTEEDLLTEAFGLFKDKAYFKSILVGTEVATDATLIAAAVKLASLQKTDALLTSPILLPFTTVATPATDALYIALDAAELDAFMVANPGMDRNGAFYTLSVALSVLNGSGTPIGNNFDFVGVSGIAASGVDGAPLSVTIQALLKEMNVSYYKPVGDSTGNVAAYGAKSIRGELLPAFWIVRYCNYRCKAQVAGYITKMNTFRNNAAYQGILSIMSRIVELFTGTGSGRLTGYTVTAPLFTSLPESGSTITIPNAWKATYADNVRRVGVSGALEIVEG